MQNVSHITRHYSCTKTLCEVLKIDLTHSSIDMTFMCRKKIDDFCSTLIHSFYIFQSGSNIVSNRKNYEWFVVALIKHDISPTL